MRNAQAEAVVQELFTTPEGRTDPYPRYHRLRELAPIHRSDLGMWVLTRYDDCWAAMRDPRFGKDYARQAEDRAGPDWRQHFALTAGEHSMINVHGPDHTRLRRLVVKGFNRRTVDGLRPFIESTVNGLLDDFAESPTGDIMSALGFPLPVTIIGEMLGVPAPDRAQFRKLVADVLTILEVRPTTEQLAVADAAQHTIRDYFLDLIAEKRGRPTDDLLGRLIKAEDQGDRLSDDELVTMATLLFIAGFETTTNLFGNGLIGLLKHPDQIALLRSDASYFTKLPDELLRYDGTAQMTVRATETDVEVGGVTIPKNELVFSLLGAGNHDPAEFPNPDMLDLTRADLHPLSFGGGVHFCLGAALARAETEITFRLLLDRFDSIELAAEPRFHDRLTLRGVPALELTCHSAARDTQRSSDSVTANTALLERALAPSAAETSTSDAAPSIRPRSGDGNDAGWRDALRRQTERIANDPESRALNASRIAATAALLARTALFRSCAPEELAELALTAYPISFEPGDALCTEGGASLECYAIAEGEAAVTIAGRFVTTVGEDDVVGERGPLEDSVRTATVTATTHMVTYAISRQRLLSLVGRSPRAAEGMFEELRRRYAHERSAA